jgi:prefoldin subunit 5
MTELELQLYELKQAHKKLKAQNERLKSLINSLVQCIEEIKKVSQSAEILTNKDNINLKLNVSSRDLHYKSVFDEDKN